MFIMYHYASVCCSSRFILVVYVFILVHLCFICVFVRGQSAGDLAGSSSPRADAATSSSSAAADIVEGPTATTASGNCEGHAATVEGHASTSTASRPFRHRQGFEEEVEDGIRGLGRVAIP